MPHTATDDVLRVLDLFSGIGGFSLGLERTGGFRTIGFCEIDPYCRAVLRKHWPDVPCYDDVRDLHAYDTGPVDVICGGFPCQDISGANPGGGSGLAGERSGLWFQYRRLVEELKPAWVIVENVSVLRARGLEVVLQGLNALGYCAEWHCIPASAVGAPHRRDRIWIAAYRDSNSDGQPSMPVDAKAPGVQGDMAYAGGARLALRELLAGVRSQAQRGDEGEDSAMDGEDVADTGRLPQGRRTEPGEAEGWRPLRESSGPGWWFVEPDVGRVANGVPSRVDRLRALGNAVVPQIPEIIGRAILAAEGVET